MTAEAVSELLSILGPAGASVAAVVYLFRVLPPAPRKHERDAYGILKSIDSRVARIEGNMDEASRERSALAARLAAVEATQKIIASGIGK